jgi:hypothetical protein
MSARIIGYDIYMWMGESSWMRFRDLFPRRRRPGAISSRFLLQMKPRRLPSGASTFSPMADRLSSVSRMCVCGRASEREKERECERVCVCVRESRVSACTVDRMRAREHTVHGWSVQFPRAILQYYNNTYPGRTVFRAGDQKKPP